MMKMAGCFLVLCATTTWGLEKAKRLTNQIEQLKYLQRIICLLQSEIRYSRSFLGEIFCQIGQGAKEPFKTWFLDMGDRIEEFQGDSIETIWKISCEKHLQSLRLPSHEIEALKSLGNQLGMADVQVQIRLIDLYLDHLERSINDLHAEIQTKVKVYHCLGVMSGLLVSVLLF